MDRFYTSKPKRIPDRVCSFLSPESPPTSIPRAWHGKVTANAIATIERRSKTDAFIPIQVFQFGALVIRRPASQETGFWHTSGSSGLAF